MISIIIELILKKIKYVCHLSNLRQKYLSCKFYDGVTVVESSLGDFVVCFKDVFIFKSKISSHTYVQKNTSIYNSEIGPFCSIAENVVIGLVGHPTHFISTHPAFYDSTQPLPYFLIDKGNFSSSDEKTFIEADVWIGHGAFIKAGVRIGVGSVVAAGAVVTKDFPPYSIIGGVPAKLIKRRFENIICEELVESRWWTISSDDLKKYNHLFDKPIEFIQELKRVKK